MQKDADPKDRCSGCGAKLETKESKEKGKCITCRERDRPIERTKDPNDYNNHSKWQ